MEIDDVVLAIDAERERISLGIKQIEKDPFSAYLAQHEKGSIVKGTVLKIEPQGITDNLAAGGGGVISERRNYRVIRSMIPRSQ
jgi:small subunit ribosomal protein S1